MQRMNEAMVEQRRIGMAFARWPVAAFAELWVAARREFPGKVAYENPHDC